MGKAIRQHFDIIIDEIDYLLLSNTLPWSGVAGMGAILLGIMMVLRTSRL